MLALPPRRQPVAQALGVEAGAGRVEEAHRQRGPGNPQPLSGRQQRVRHQRLAHVQRAREPGPAQPGPAVRAEHGDVEAVLQVHRRGHPEPGDQLTVGGAAAEEHVLAVVDHQPAPGEGAGRTPQPGPGLQQRDPVARLAQGDRGRDPGQAAADHHQVAAAARTGLTGRRCRGRAAAGAAGPAPGRGHRGAPAVVVDVGGPERPDRRAEPASDFTATIAFWPGERETRRCSTSLGGVGDVLQQAEVDPGHRAGARRAAPVEHRHQPQPARVPVPRPLRLERHEIHQLGVGGAEPADPLGRNSVPNRLKSSAGRYTRPSR